MIKKVKHLDHMFRVYGACALSFYKLFNDNRIVSGPNKITMELYKYYSEQFKKPELDMSNSHEAGVFNECSEIFKVSSNSEEEIERTNIGKIRRIIKSFKLKIPVSSDQISNFIIKKLPKNYMECLVACFNQWLNECKYPEERKLAKVLTLNKLKARTSRCDLTHPTSFLAMH